MLAGQPAPVVLREIAPLGDADERVVRLVVAGMSEVGLVGGDERQAQLVGERHQLQLDGLRLGEAMPLQLDVEPIAENLREAFDAARRQRHLRVAKSRVDRPVGAAGQSDQAGRMLGEESQRHLRRRRAIAIEPGRARQRHQIAIARLVLGDERDPLGLSHARLGPAGGPLLRLHIGEIDADGHADDWLDAGAREFLGELERSEQIVGVGQREGRHGVGLSELGQRLDLQRAFQQRIGRVGLQMHEGRCLCHLSHAACSPAKSLARMAPIPGACSSHFESRVLFLFL